MEEGMGEGWEVKCGSESRRGSRRCVGGVKGK